MRITRVDLKGESTKRREGGKKNIKTIQYVFSFPLDSINITKLCDTFVLFS
jgi:hypothetical protein